MSPVLQIVPLIIRRLDGPSSGHFTFRSVPGRKLAFGHISCSHRGGRRVTRRAVAKSAGKTRVREGTHWLGCCPPEMSTGEGCGSSSSAAESVSTAARQEAIGIPHGVVREQRRGPVTDGTCAVSDGWGCSAGTRALVLYPSAQLSRSYGPDAAAAKWRRAPAFSSNCRTGVSGTTRSPVSALRPHGAPPPRLRSSGAPRRSISNADVTSRGAAQPHSHSRHRSDSAESNSRRPHAGHVWDVPAAGTSMTAPPTLAKPQIVAHGQAVDDARHNHEVVPAQKHP